VHLQAPPFPLPRLRRRPLGPRLGVRTVRAGLVLAFGMRSVSRVPNAAYTAAVPRGTDYALARRAVLRDLRLGTRAREDVCDAHPELVRAARNVGEPATADCPVCGGGELYFVSYVYGDGLKAANGCCLSYPGELDKLRAKHDEFDCYVVEVCVDCRWNHLGRRELHGRRHAG